MTEVENPYEPPAPIATKDLLDANLEHRNDHREYKMVRLGLQLFYYSLLAMIGGGLLVIFGTTVLALVSGFGAMESLLLLLPFGILCVASMLLMLVGYCMCVAAPRPNERNMAIWMLVTQFLGIALAVVSALIVSVPSDFEMALDPTIVSETQAISEAETSLLGVESIFDLLGNVLTIISSFCFVFFCKRIGQNVGSDKLVKDSLSTLYWYIAMTVCTGIFVAATPLLMTSPDDWGVVTLVLIVLFATAGLGSFFKMVMMLQAAIKTLGPSS